MSMVGLLCVEEARHGEGRRQHQDAREDRLLAPHLRGDEAHGEIGDDGRGLRDNEREVIVLVQDIGGVDGVFARDGVVAEEPQYDAQQDEHQRLDLIH